MTKKPKSSKTEASSSVYLGDFSPFFSSLTYEEELLQKFKTPSFRALSIREQIHQICRSLWEKIDQEKNETFLLPGILRFIEKLHELQILENFTFNQFELWLNQFSELSFDENYRIRAKIVGKKLPRDDYQLLFPIGMGKVYPGSHFVTAHSSPDLDTTIASFWGWIDAFGARVSEGLHFWNVPGGVNEQQIEVKVLFEDIFGKGVYHHLVRNRLSLSISGIDLMTQKGVVRKRTDISSWALDLEKNQNAIVLVDEEGFYRGDWRNIDAEGVRQVIMLLNHCLRWFESAFHQKLITLFSKEDFCAQDLLPFARSFLDLKIADAEPAKEFSDTQRKLVHDYLYKVILVKEGLDGTFGDFAKAIQQLHVQDFQNFIDILLKIQHSSIFDAKGKLIADRTQLFAVLEKVIKGLDKAIHSIRVYVDTLQVALRIKTEVFAYKPVYISHRADVEEIRSKMGNNSYLTVTMPDKEGKLIPLGVIHASDLYRPVLGTSSLRDFCNREETKIPSYIEVISIVDHHKGQLQVLTPPTAHIADVQSSNVLVAQLAFRLNDKYTTFGMSEKEIEAQIQEVSTDLSSLSAKRILRKLLAKQEALQRRGKHFIHPDREFVEYLHFLYAILEDTDLLTKVSKRDIECVAELINRLKSLFLKKEIEVVHFDDLSEGPDFIATAARRLLRNPDLYSLYRKIYLFKEKIVEADIEKCATSQSEAIFNDTKEQNGCCRVGQTKLFPNNYPCFAKHVKALQKAWYEQAEKFYKEKKEIDLHLHMVSTIDGVESLYSGKQERLAHQDELWVWIPIEQDQAIQHLKSFLYAIRKTQAFTQNDITIQFLGKDAKKLSDIFTESFLSVPENKITIDLNSPLSMAILRFNAGSINSRKAMISPYLPKLVS